MMSRACNRRVVGVILAGGEGKRLRPLTYYFQKCMIPIGSRQKPLLEYILLHLKKHGIVDVKLLVGYKHEQIVNYFNDGGRFGINIQYIIDEPNMGGSGGALLNAAKKGAFKGADSILVYYGDILSDIDLSAMLRQHLGSGTVATLAVTRGFEVPVGVADIDGRTVKSWVEKPRIDIYAGIGILLLQAKIIDLIEKLCNVENKLDIMGDLVPYLIDKGRHVESYLTDAFWYDIASAEKYEKIDNNQIDKIFNV